MVVNVFIMSFRTSLRTTYSLNIFLQELNFFFNPKKAAVQAIRRREKLTKASLSARLYKANSPT